MQKFYQTSKVFPVHRVLVLNKLLYTQNAGIKRRAPDPRLNYRHFEHEKKWKPTYTPIMPLNYTPTPEDLKWKLYEKWKEEGADFNVNFFRGYLNACVIHAAPDRPEYVDKAHMVINDYKSCGFKMDTLMYNMLIQVYAKTQNTEKAFETKKQLIEEGLEPDQVTYGALIRACILAKKEDKERARKEFEEMRSKNMLPSFIEFDRLYEELKRL